MRAAGRRARRDWLTELREAMGAVDGLRAQGPDVTGAAEPEATES